VASRRHLVAFALAAWGCAALAAVAAAQGQALEPRLRGRALALALAEGGHVILWRHTATDDFVPASDVVDPADCSAQRNLSEQGRRDARLVGRAFAKLGIRVDRVVASPSCRCQETGRLAFGEVETDELLSSGDELDPAEKEARGASIRALLARAPAPGANTVLITHTANLLYSFGLLSRPEGIAHVFLPAAVGPAGYVGYLLPGEWPEIAGIPPEVD
jgi:phosphohistidine phosphatase SixA